MIYADIPKEKENSQKHKHFKVASFSPLSALSQYCVNI